MTMPQAPPPGGPSGPNHPIGAPAPLLTTRALLLLLLTGIVIAVAIWNPIVGAAIVAGCTVLMLLVKIVGP